MQITVAARATSGAIAVTMVGSVETRTLAALLDRLGSLRDRPSMEVDVSGVVLSGGTADQAAAALARLGAVDGVTVVLGDRQDASSPPLLAVVPDAAHLEVTSG